MKSKSKQLGAKNIDKVKMMSEKRHLNEFLGYS